ncbi:MAG TPA: two-component sensor histidine kinase [Bacteroidales bacterium]|nr:two-component sensor histidine kinase [Bacteroidales bacterium]HBZ66151.1 two-component sensor histidine kinase [Bacteroidales bacterium]
MAGDRILTNSNQWGMVVLISSIVGIVSFFVLYHLINKFIYARIRVIYKTIHQQKIAKSVNRQLLTPDSIEKVNQEVLDWSRDKKDEISRLHELENYRREYIGNISHELKTPIFNIQGYVLTLLEGGLEDPSINREYLLRTEKSINRMIAIVEDLETITQLESNELKLKKANFDLVALAREVIDSLEMKAARREIQLFLSHDEDQPCFVMADRDRIAQVFTNLVENAIKYGKKGEGRVKISFFDMDENILAEVTDNGPGIAPSDLPRVFERFYRTDKARSREQGGTGLGLAIVKHIIEAHQQSVNVRSTPGIGTTFGFTLKKV